VLQVTIVEPAAKREPDAGEHEMLPLTSTPS
jgi:hypothetical protein